MGVVLDYVGCKQYNQLICVQSQLYDAYLIGSNPIKGTFMFDKSIKSGKEFRKPYRGAKKYDKTCRNHGSCEYCKSNRTAKEKIKKDIADEKIKEYKRGG